MSDDARYHAPAFFARLQALAERDPRRAVAIATRVTLTTPVAAPLLHAWAVATGGWALVCWERLVQARPHLLSAQRSFLAHDAPVAALHVQFMLLLLDQRQSAHSGLEYAFADLAGQFDQAGDAVAAIRARLYSAVQFNVMGQPQEARAILAHCASAIAAAPPMIQARALSIAGYSAVLAGNYAEASRLFAQAQKLFNTLRAPLEVAKCAFEQAWCALCQEQLDVALAGYERAQAVFARLDLPVRRAFCAKNIGLALMKQGAYDSALAQTQQALEQFRALDRPSEIGGCHLHLGNIYLYTGSYTAALASYKRAEEWYVVAGARGYQLVAQRNQALAYRASGQWATAQTLLTELEQVAHSTGNRVELAEIWSQQASLLVSIGQDSAAQTRYQLAHDLFVEAGNIPASAECLLEQSWIALRHGEVAHAIEQFQAVAPVLASQPHHAWRVYYGWARCAQEQADVVTALAQYQRATAMVAQLRRRLLSEEVSSQLSRQAAQLYQDACALAVQVGAANTLLLILEEQRALVLQQLLTTSRHDLRQSDDSELENLQNQISTLLIDQDSVGGDQSQALDTALTAYSDAVLRARHRTDNSRSLTQFDITFTVSAFRACAAAQYGDDWTVLVYAQFDTRLLCCVLTPEDLSISEIVLDNRLQRLIAQASQPQYRWFTYRDLAYQQGKTTEPWQVLRNLARTLLPPSVITRLHTNHRLLIVPSGLLHSIPWAALRTQDGWLIEQAVPQVLPSLTVWQVLNARRSAVERRALLIGCSSFGERASALPAVPGELDAVARIWPGPCTQVRNEAATCKAVVHMLSNEARYTILHIASHAHLLPARGLMAHLKLWDGDLTLPDATALQLNGVHVTLSACDGAATDVLPGDEVLSMSWGLLAGGAKSVLASLWPVDDAGVFSIIQRYYQVLAQHGDTAYALAYAQRALLAQHVHEEMSIAPDQWACFLVTGDGALY